MDQNKNSEVNYYLAAGLSAIPLTRLPLHLQTQHAACSAYLTPLQLPFLPGVGDVATTFVWTCKHFSDIRVTWLLTVLCYGVHKISILVFERPIVAESPRVSSACRSLEDNLWTIF